MKLHEIRSFVFTSFAHEGELDTTEIELIAVHVLDVFKKPSTDGVIQMPRIYDKLLLRLNSDQKKNFSQSNSKSIVENFLKLQAVPICFVWRKSAECDISMLMKYFGEISNAENIYQVNFEEIERVISCVRKEYSLEQAFTQNKTNVMSSATVLAKACFVISIYEEFKNFTCRSVCENQEEDSKNDQKAGVDNSLVEEIVDNVDGQESSEMATYVIFDLETTDLRDRKITEIYMAAVARCHLGVIEDVNPYSVIQDKIRILVDPQRPVEPVAVDLTGLTWDDLVLRQKRPWSLLTNTLVANFLKRQKQPLCILAYNGNSFDLNVLKMHIGPMSVEKYFSPYFSADVMVGMSRLLKEDGVKLKNRKLDNMFKHLVGKFEIQERHSAEGDVNATIAILQKSPGDILQWFDQYNVPFNGRSFTRPQRKKKKKVDKSDKNEKENVTPPLKKRKRKKEKALSTNFETNNQNESSPPTS